MAEAPFHKADMALVPVNRETKDQDQTTIRQEICSLLSKGPQKARDIARHVGMTTKEVNHHLYDMKITSGLSMNNETKLWSLNRPEMTAHTAETLVPVNRINENRSLVKLDQDQTAELKQHILTLLANGPQRALIIARHIGKKTRKDVNPLLYALKNAGDLCYDDKTKLWSLQSPETKDNAGCTINNINVYQQHSTNIYMQGQTSSISISDSQNIQIGSHNSINTLSKSDATDNPVPEESGKREASLCFPATTMSDRTISGDAAPETPPQTISIKDSFLQNTIIGNNNEMNVNCTDGNVNSSSSTAYFWGTGDIEYKTGEGKAAARSCAENIPQTPADLEITSLCGKFNQVIIGDMNRISTVTPIAESDSESEDEPVTEKLFGAEE
uniref:Z-DNA-binding protein 1 isoform X3 n=1 Tax=Geotrypetes seraphini TaxID=260995 RepID=A0A6P8NIC0_GEOSA|nr:Z-DNA-binding protein 1 isoform X3 [Geotrypetes seraphini]